MCFTMPMPKKDILSSKQIQKQAREVVRDEVSKLIAGLENEGHSLEEKTATCDPSSNEVTCDPSSNEVSVPISPVVRECSLSSSPLSSVSPAQEDNDCVSLSDFIESGESSSSTDEETECDPEVDDLKSSLQVWGNRYNITNTAFNSLLCILKPYHPELPQDSRTIKKTPTSTNVKVLENGQYSHLGLEQGILSKLKSGTRANCTKLELEIFCDGLKLYNSVMTEAWPILFRSKSFLDTRPSVVGIFYGDGKPAPINDYLADLIAELKKLKAEGVNFSNTHYEVDLKFFLADAPARSFLKNIVGHTSKNGCERCDEEGDFVDHVIYSTKIGNARTDSSFDVRRDSEHHKGNTPLSELQIKCISQVPLDPMHLIDLGVFKRFLEFVLSRAPRKEAKVSYVKVFGEFLEVLADFIPCEFSRKPMLRRLSKWKSKEYRLVLLYLGPLIFLSLLKEEVYKVYLLLHTAVLIMHSDVLIDSFLDNANQFISDFVVKSAKVFGSKFVVYNVHSAMHLADDVKRFGNLMSFSAYPFEDKLGSIKRLIRSSNKPLQQLLRRLTERELAEVDSKFSQERARGLLHVHSDGPTANLCVDTLFSKYEHEQFTLTLKIPNNCVCLSDGRIGLVQNIVLCQDRTVNIVVQLFQTVNDLYKYPMCSSDLGVCVVNDQSDNFQSYLLSDVLYKCFIMPFENEEFVVMPLLHLL